MKQKFSNLSFKLSIALVIIFSFLVLNLSKADTRPQIIITWKSGSYAPASFNGKILPSQGSKIDAGVEVLDGTSFGNLSGADITWILNGDTLQEITGGQRVKFIAPNDPGGIESLEVKISNYKGSSFGKTIQVPIVSPEVVARKNFSGNIFSGKQISLSAKPYFFNIQSLDELNFDWLVNGQKPTQGNDPSLLDVNVQGSSGSTVSVGLTVSSQSQKADTSLGLQFNP